MLLTILVPTGQYAEQLWALPQLDCNGLGRGNSPEILIGENYYHKPGRLQRKSVSLGWNKLT